MNKKEIIDEQLKLIAKREDMFKELGREFYANYKLNNSDLSYMMDKFDSDLKEIEDKIKLLEEELKRIELKKDGDAEKRRSEDFNRESVD